MVRVRAGSAEIPIYKGLVNGRVRYTVAFYRDGFRVRRTFANLAVAKIEARRAASLIQGGRANELDLGPAARAVYMAATELLKPSGIPLLAAVQEYMAARNMLDNGPLLAAVEEYARRTRGMARGVTVAEAVAECLGAKAQDGGSARYLSALRCDLGRFAAAFPGPITAVGSGRIDGWLRGLGVGPRRRNGMLGSVQTLFSFARSRSYLPRNDRTEADALAKIRVPDTDVGIFTPDQFRAVLQAATPEIIPFLVIGGFAGLRSAEIQRLDWSAIDLERRVIEIRPRQAKTASRRIVPVSDNLAAWLRPHAARGPIVPPGQVDRKFRAAARTAEVAWPHNVLRHSYISYRIALVKSADQVALEAGNSPAIIFKHYRELVTEEQAREWFAVMPGGAANVVSFAAVTC